MAKTPRSNDTTNVVFYAPHRDGRRDPSRLPPQARIKADAQDVERYFAPPEPYQVRVVWKVDRLGPRPDYPCKFVDEAPPTGDYLFARAPSGSHRRIDWWVKMRPVQEGKSDRWTTKCLLDDIEGAVGAYIDFWRDLMKERINGTAPKARVLAEVLQDYVRKLSKRLGPGSGQITEIRFRNALQTLRRLYPFVDNMRVGDLKEDFTGEFMTWAKTPQPWRRGYAHDTARSTLCTLRAALESELREGYYVAQFTIPPEQVVGVRVFSAEELMRIKLAADNGWIWDRDKRDWRRTAEGAYVTRPSHIVDAARPYGRLSEIGWVFGNRLDVFLRLDWEDRGGPWIDALNLTKTVVGSAPRDDGTYYRLGRLEVCDGKMTGEREIPKAHLKKLRAWREEDMKVGRVRVLHGSEGQPINSFNYGVWDDLLVAAGAQALHPHCLKHTCVTFLRRKNVSRAAAAAYLSTHPHTLDKYYGKHDADVRAPAVAALDDPLEAFVGPPASPPRIDANAASEALGSLDSFDGLKDAPLPPEAVAAVNDNETRAA